MKCLIQFSGKNKKNVINVLSAELAKSLVKVKVVMYIWWSLWWRQAGFSWERINGFPYIETAQQFLLLFERVIALDIKKKKKSNFDSICWESIEVVPSNYKLIVEITRAFLEFSTGTCLCRIYSCTFQSSYGPWLMSHTVFTHYISSFANALIWTRVGLHDTVASISDCREIQGLQAIWQILAWPHNFMTTCIHPFCWFKKGSCQLLVKVWAQSTG